MPRLAVTSIALVNLLDEAGKLRGGASHRAQRLLVVHSDGAEQADGPEGAVGEAVGRTDEREPLQVGMIEVDADPDERAARIDRLAEHLEQRRALLEQLEQPLVGVKLVPARAFEQSGGAADIEALPLLEQLGG